MNRKFRDWLSGSFIAAVLLLQIVYAQEQTLVGEGLNGQTLFDFVVANYTTTHTLNYDRSTSSCRDIMYAVIDLRPGNKVRCVYSGFVATLDLNQDPSTYLYNTYYISCEHTWPQSMFGNATGHPKNDIHNLYPVLQTVNSARSNYAFAEIDDEKTDKWYRKDTVWTTIPTEYIDEYSEKESSYPQKFEPREDHKGNVARSMFYFFTIYNSIVDKPFWNGQKKTLLKWNYYDPVDSIEYQRTWSIAAYQDNKPNPFVLDSTLARRIWFYVDTDVQKESIANEFRLSSNYPNPFNGSTTFSFSLPQNGELRIDIYDLIGKQVASIGGDRYSTGAHHIEWNPQNLHSGIYVYKIIYNGEPLSGGKCVYLK